MRWSEAKKEALTPIDLVVREEGGRLGSRRRRLVGSSEVQPDWKIVEAIPERW